jgi:hypothetical protein
MLVLVDGKMQSKANSVEPPYSHFSLPGEETDATRELVSIGRLRTKKACDRLTVTFQRVG